MKTLVVYFSRKGYTKKEAYRVAKAENADIYELTTTERTRKWLGFMWCGRFNMHRWEMPIPPITVDLTSYDKVIVCSPIWVFTFCAPVRAFLTHCKGKIKSIEYIFVHFSSPSGYKNSMKRADELVGIKHSKFTSVMCMWGKIFYRKEGI